MLQPVGNFLRGHEVGDDAQLVTVLIEVFDRLRTVGCDHAAAVFVAIFDGQLDRVFQNQLARIFRREPACPEFRLRRFLHGFKAPFAVAFVTVVQKLAERIRIARFAAELGDALPRAGFKVRVALHQAEGSAEVVENCVKFPFHPTIFPLRYALSGGKMSRSSEIFVIV